MDVLWVAAGGAAGAVSRYVVDRALTQAFGVLGLGTIVVNVSGSFALGLLAAIVMERGVLSPELRALLGIGFLGAYTTFSTFSLEAWRMVEGQAPAMAVLYIAATVVLGLSSLVAGLWLGRALGT